MHSRLWQSVWQPRLRTFLALPVLLLLVACGSWHQAPPKGVAQAVDSGWQACHDRLGQRPGPGGLADTMVGYRPPAQPYFMIDRLHADFDVAALDDTAFQSWRQGVLARSGRALAEWSLVATGTVDPVLLSCLETLAAGVGGDVWARYAQAAREHSHYRGWQRVLGLYPALAPLVAWRIRALQADWREAYGRLPPGPLHRYQSHSWQRIPERPSPLDSVVALPAQPSPETVRQWLAAAVQADPLGLPRLPAGQLEALFALHAPEWVTARSDPAGVIGRVVLGGSGPAFDDSEAAVYLDHGFARAGDAYRLQLMYQVWFEERPARGRLDLYSGRWNGLIWRVTLDAGGQPLWYDSVHNCGCYHQVWLDHRASPRATRGLESPVFLPLDWSGRPRLFLAPGTHHIQAVRAAADPVPDRATDKATVPLSADSLRLLQDPGSGRTASFYNARGLVEGSERLERWLLWPFGVESPGTMRQPGTHAIAFVGQRHFDDPQLFQSLLRLQPP